MTALRPTIVWFRQDLRLADNPALAAAATAGPIIPLFILDETGPGRTPGAASKWWLDKSLRALARDLAARGSPLILRRGRAKGVLEQVVAEAGAAGVTWNRLYDPASVARDTEIKTALRARGLEVRSFNGALLNEPWTIETAAGGPYKVFTPYWRAAAPLAEQAAPGPDATTFTAPSARVGSAAIDDWGLHPTKPDWSSGFADWRPGEAGAMARLQSFLDDAASAYLDHRNLPALPGTSRLSPHLGFGEISPRQVWAAAKASVLARGAPERHIDGFLRELGWREFNHHLLFHFPHMERDGFNPRFADFPWRDDPAGLEAWRRGRTGYPIVDAGMRELWATGWMHNRVRMIVASFLTKDLMIDWREGESWFWDTLVDADLANNVAGWQWVAGVGADAAPYHRVFNPVLQGEKFDPAGEYVRRWLPELALLPNDCIHQPWRAGPWMGAGARRGVTYPVPIVDHAAARQRALAAYEKD
jgi:deoxyribodipyrimidine photo-lyase